MNSELMEVRTPLNISHHSIIFIFNFGLIIVLSLYPLPRVTVLRTYDCEVTFQI